jgi:hypothetical protein
MCIVVNIKNNKKYDIYIGRGNCPITGNESKWGNPYSHDPDSLAKFIVHTREEAVEKFEEYLLNNKELMNSLPELMFKTLGCWCNKNQKCHGQVIKKYVDKLEQKYYLDKILRE